MRNKKWVFIIGMLILIGGGFLTYKIYFQKALTEKAIMDHIKEKGYTDKIENKKMVYDSKQGVYYMVVYYKDEKGIRYEYFCNGGLIPANVFVLAYDQTNAEITKRKEKGKYLEE
ncbi:DUF3139 domain-containing protein [Bacillus smithii]|uniref:DUF3139 domain-containing protein n=1 Tax=Bacillus smithii TaxID=1479 RepID=UPI0022E5BD04|nr:DUF3139 domain-containing protein [Bacillus smithii]MED0659410.1 DUF3139 domain-containing protein [Bacillus smithii]